MPDSEPSRERNHPFAWHAGWHPWWAGLDPDVGGAAGSEASESRFEERRRSPKWPVLLSLAVQFPLLLLAMAGRLPPPSQGALMLAFLASFALLGVWSRPGPTVAAVGLLTAPAIGLVSFWPPTQVVPLVFAIMFATMRGARVWVWGTIAAGTLTVIGASLVLDSHPASAIRLLMTVVVLCLFVGIGEARRSRRERFRQFRVAQSQRRQSEAERERVRIARELHDVLAHSLSSINVQAGVGLHLIDSQPERAAQSLAAIKEASKQALDEVRGVLGLLRSGTSADPAAAAPRVPEPDLSRLPALVEASSGSGVAVTVTNHLTSYVPPMIQRAIYRIVQESLTNVIRHATASRAEVTAAVDGADYLITIADDGTGPQGTPADSEGRGILGMRERAQLLGGTLETTQAPGQGFLVIARIPRETPTGSDEGHAS